MKPKAGSLRGAIAPVVVAVALVASACGSSDGDGSSSPELAGVVRSPALSVGEVELPDVAASGDPAAMKAAQGELLLVYFGYTFCPDICPTTMSDISVAINELPGDLGQRVEVGMVTVDPDRDTDEALTAYLGHFFDRSRALRTDDIAALDAAAETFGVRYEVEDHEDDDTDYEVSHSAVTYVVDDTGVVAVEWPFGLDSLDMAADLETLLTKEQS